MFVEFFVFVDLLVRVVEHFVVDVVLVLVGCVVV